MKNTGSDYYDAWRRQQRLTNHQKRADKICGCGRVLRMTRIPQEQLSGTNPPLVGQASRTQVTAQAGKQVKRSCVATQGGLK